MAKIRMICVHLVDLFEYLTVGYFKHIYGNIFDEKEKSGNKKNGEVQG